MKMISFVLYLMVLQSIVGNKLRLALADPDDKHAGQSHTRASSASYLLRKRNDQSRKLADSNVISLLEDAWKVNGGSIDKAVETDCVKGASSSNAASSTTQTSKSSKSKSSKRSLIKKSRIDTASDFNRRLKGSKSSKGSKGSKSAKTTGNTNSDKPFCDEEVQDQAVTGSSVQFEAIDTSCQAVASQTLVTDGTSTTFRIYIGLVVDESVVDSIASDIQAILQEQVAPGMTSCVETNDDQRIEVDSESDRRERHKKRRVAETAVKPQNIVFGDMELIENDAFCQAKNSFESQNAACIKVTGAVTVYGDEISEFDAKLARAPYSEDVVAMDGVLGITDVAVYSSDESPVSEGRGAVKAMDANVGAAEVTVPQSNVQGASTNKLLEPAVLIGIAVGVLVLVLAVLFLVQRRRRQRQSARVKQDIRTIKRDLENTMYGDVVNSASTLDGAESESLCCIHDRNDGMFGEVTYDPTCSGRHNRNSKTVRSSYSKANKSGKVKASDKKQMARDSSKNKSRQKSTNMTSADRSRLQYEIRINERENEPYVDGYEVRPHNQK